MASHRVRFNHASVAAMAEFRAHLEDPIDARALHERDVFPSGELVTTERELGGNRALLRSSEGGLAWLHVDNDGMAYDATRIADEEARKLWPALILQFSPEELTKLKAELQPAVTLKEALVAALGFRRVSRSITLGLQRGASGVSALVSPPQQEAPMELDLFYYVPLHAVGHLPQRLNEPLPAPDRFSRWTRRATELERGGKRPLRQYCPRWLALGSCQRGVQPGRALEGSLCQRFGHSVAEGRLVLRVEPMSNRTPEKRLRLPRGDALRVERTAAGVIERSETVHGHAAWAYVPPVMDDNHT